jgi:hypothetical protein
MGLGLDGVMLCFGKENRKDSGNANTQGACRSFLVIMA